MDVPQDIADGLERVAGVQQPRRQGVAEQVDPLAAVPVVQSGPAQRPPEDRRQVVVGPEGLIGGQVPHEDVADLCRRPAVSQVDDESVGDLRQ
jgi:hypothetical protein